MRGSRRLARKPDKKTNRRRLGSDEGRPGLMARLIPGQERQALVFVPPSCAAARCSRAELSARLPG